MFGRNPYEGVDIGVDLLDEPEEQGWEHGGGVVNVAMNVYTEEEPSRSAYGTTKPVRDNVNSSNNSTTEL